MVVRHALTELLGHFSNGGTKSRTTVTLRPHCAVECCKHGKVQGRPADKRLPGQALQNMQHCAHCSCCLVQGQQADEAAAGLPGRAHQDLHHRDHRSNGAVPRGDTEHTGLCPQSQEHPQQVGLGPSGCCQALLPCMTGSSQR